MFLMTVEQYKARAASLRASGNEQLAQQYDNLIRQHRDDGIPDVKTLQANVDGVRKEIRNLVVAEPGPQPTTGPGSGDQAVRVVSAR